MCASSALQAHHRLGRVGNLLRLLQLGAEQVPVGVAQQVLSDAQRPESLGRGVHPRKPSAFSAVQRNVMMRSSQGVPRGLCVWVAGGTLWQGGTFLLPTLASALGLDLHH